MPASDPTTPAGVRRARLTRWSAVGLSVVLALVAADVLVERSLAQVELPKKLAIPSSSQVYDRHGNLIGTYRDEIARFIIDTEKLPDHVPDAVIAAEDKDFYEHEGLSLSGVVRAAWENVTSRQVEQGGSTITQQYVKNGILADTDRTIQRKVKEAVLAIKLERELSKDEILDRYLNFVYFGRGAYGIEAAARVYFGTHATDLTLAQSAFLAGLIPSPESYQSKSRRDAAIQRRDAVLGAMHEEGYISERERARAARRKLRLDIAPEMRQKTQRAAYFMEWLRKEYLYPHFGDCLYTCGLKIHTTLDLDMQRAAERSIASTLTEKSHPQAALVSMTPNGRVRALVGGRHFRNVRMARGFNFATDGVRHAGSAFKPFTLLAAIESGISTRSRFSGRTPKTIDDPACTGPDGVWEPENYAGSSFGAIDLDQATANSVNTVYAELAAEVGPAKIADLVERFGFGRPPGPRGVPAHCSLALGAYDVSALEMARAYAAIAARGVLPRVVPIARVEDRFGNCLLGFGTPKKMGCEKRRKTAGKRIVEENSVDVLTRSLTGVLTSGTATSAQIGRPAAGKTGTAQDNRDAWFAGYVPQLATVVWMGYPVLKGPDGKLGTADDLSRLMGYCSDPRRCQPVNGIDVTGGSFPATIWAAYMQAALEGVDVRSFIAPAFEPSTILNPPPPPEKKGKKKDDKEETREGRGNSGRGNDKGKKDDD